MKGGDVLWQSVLIVVVILITMANVKIAKHHLVCRLPCNPALGLQGSGVPLKMKG